MTAAIIVFTLTYVAVAGGRLPGLSLDRPAAALLGAVFMVALGVLTPKGASDAVNGDTLGLLLGMMILAAYLTEAGFFKWASWRVITGVSTRRALLWGLTLTAGGLSTILVNDTVCLMMTPLVVRMIDDGKLPPTPYLLAVAFGSNAGSVATLTGNPQNMIVGTMSGISYGQFARALLVPAAVSLVMVAALLQWMFRAELNGPPLAEAVHKLQRPPIDRKLLAKSLSITGLAVAGFLAGFPLSWTALFTGALLMAIAGRVPRHALQRVDWPLLVFFAGLFIVVAGIGQAGVAERMYQGIAPLLGTSATRHSIVFSLFTVVGSQIVSNVPFVILAGHWIPRMADPHLLWLATACAATLAGNLTLVGSVANLIVVEMAGGRISIGFWRFLRYGAVVTIATLAVSLAILLAEQAAGLV